MYDYNFKELLFDDNRLGALRTFPINRPCYQKHNRNSRFCCYIVVFMIWDRRPSSCGGGGIYLFIDARGESDLSSPGSSKINARIGIFEPVQFIPFLFNTNINNQQLPNENHHNNPRSVPPLCFSRITKAL